MWPIGGELGTTITSPSCWGTHFLYLSNPPIWEPPSHYSMRQSQRAVSRCVEAAAPAVSAAQDTGEDRLRSDTSARRHGGWVAALLSYTPHTYPHPRSLLVSWYWGHVQHDPCEGRPSVCSGARKAVVLLMVKRRSEGSCACGRHTSTHIYLPTTFYAQIKARYHVDTTIVAHILINVIIQCSE